MIVFPRKNQSLIKYFRREWKIPEYEGFLINNKYKSPKDFLNAKNKEEKEKHEKRLRAALGGKKILTPEEEENLIHFMRGGVDYNSQEFQEIYERNLAKNMLDQLSLEEELEDENKNLFQLFLEKNSKSIGGVNKWEKKINAESDLENNKGKYVVFFDRDMDDIKAIEEWDKGIDTTKFMQATYKLTEELTESAGITARLWRQFIYHFVLSSRISLRPLGAFASTYMYDRLVQIEGRVYIDLSPDLKQEEFFAILKEFRDSMPTKKKPDKYNPDEYHDIMKKRYGGAKSGEINKNYKKINDILFVMKKEHPEWL